MQKTKVVFIMLKVVKNTHHIVFCDFLRWSMTSPADTPNLSPIDKTSINLFSRMLITEI